MPGDADGAGVAAPGAIVPAVIKGDVPAVVGGGVPPEPAVPDAVPFARVDGAARSDEAPTGVGGADAAAASSAGDGPDPPAGRVAPALTEPASGLTRGAADGASPVRAEVGGSDSVAPSDNVAEPAPAIASRAVAADPAADPDGRARSATAAWAPTAALP